MTNHYPASFIQGRIGGGGLYSAIELGLSWLELKAGVGPDADTNQARLRAWYEAIDPETNLTREQMARYCEHVVAAAIANGLGGDGWPWDQEPSKEPSKEAPDAQ